MKDEFGEGALEEVRVFVYGTLKPGEENYGRYCKHPQKVQAAMVWGQLYDLPLGYPALTVGSLPVYGFLLSFADPDILTILDELEDYSAARPSSQNEYLRVKTQVFSLAQRSLGWAWAYHMEQMRVQQLGGILLANGKWSSRERFFRL